MTSIFEEAKLLPYHQNGSKGIDQRHCSALGALRIFMHHEKISSLLESRAQMS